MARPPFVQRIVLRGTLPGNEIWSTAFWTGINGNTGTAQQIADNLPTIGAWAAFQTAVRAMLNAGGSLSALDVYQYRTAATEATDKGTHTFTDLTGTGGGALPNQVACVMTLRSATPTRSGRGRMYFPAIGCGVGSDGLANPTQLNNLRTSLATLLSTQDSRIVSSTRGETYPLVAVDNDYVLDTIRARTDQLVSARASSTVTPNA